MHPCHVPAASGKAGLFRRRDAARRRVGRGPNARCTLALRHSCGGAIHVPTPTPRRRRVPLSRRRWARRVAARRPSARVRVRRSCRPMTGS